MIQQFIKKAFKRFWRWKKSQFYCVEDQNLIYDNRNS